MQRRRRGWRRCPWGRQTTSPAPSCLSADSSRSARGPGQGAGIAVDVWAAQEAERPPGSHQRIKTNRPPTLGVDISPVCIKLSVWLQYSPEQGMGMGCRGEAQRSAACRARRASGTARRRGQNSGRLTRGGVGDGRRGLGGLEAAGHLTVLWEGGDGKQTGAFSGGEADGWVPCKHPACIEQPL